jgi:hypothetical protein
MEGLEWFYVDKKESLIIRAIYNKYAVVADS